MVEIVFSPVGGTEKVARIIGECFDKKSAKIDLCNAKTNFIRYRISKDDMVLIAMPSYAGRAPAVAIERLKQINGNGARCIIVCVYGNLDYGDTLVEMEDVAKERGFQVIAGIAAVAEHSGMRQYGKNRPDASDVRQLISFADQIAGKTESYPVIPGKRPYKKAEILKLVPKLEDDCIKCGQCAERCPTQAIDVHSFKADPSKCIACMRCMRNCPRGARKVNDVMVSVAAMAIEKTGSVRKENELFC